jgi:transcription-repair coupling factor (superfamily II helicase)
MLASTIFTVSQDAPKIYKLGSGAWQKLKLATKKKIKDIAEDLIKLYATRKQQEGFSFSPDTYLQRELEASFIYEDTPDQVKATRDVKEGMEAGFPMDRLVCGDVGFGKTEVAIRAAFKAVTDSKQVAILVPTTILAFQHFNTFKDRLKEFPCNIEYISRFRKPADQKIILEKLAKGQIDILIGTHKLVGKEVKFKDLGLLIIDEEQKFGVGVKEKLRQMKLNVDTLTLTATPIPRTLQFSLMGARDLSIINTPPPNRHPIITELHTFNEEIIKEAIEYEVSRGGQVFFINNRIQNIEDLANLIGKICKSVRVVVAHGQMEGNKLEKTMLDFVQGDYDVLVATSIIESGLDIPNANTIIINNAHHFGLSDLHQLRGRVGRSNKKAFCYLMAPPVTLMTNEARRKMRAIEEFSDLGSGFNIAMQDLDIRGSGNLLGAEQSGFIADIGYETYQRILNEAILELRENEFKDLYPVKEEEQTTKQYIGDCQIDTDLEILLPDEYINNVSERIRLYRELDNIPDEKSLSAFENTLIDRFGKIPAQTIELLNVVRLRWRALNLGMEKIIMKNSTMIIYFIQDPKSQYYQSAVFGNVLNFVQRMGRRVVLKEENLRLSLRIPEIKNVKNAIDILDKIIV